MHSWRGMGAGDKKKMFPLNKNNSVHATACYCFGSGSETLIILQAVCREYLGVREQDLFFSLTRKSTNQAGGIANADPYQKQGWIRIRKRIK